MPDNAILGVDLGGTRLRAGKVRDGRVESSASRLISAKESEEHVLGEIFETLDGIVDGEVAGIGFCVPTVVDVEKGIVYEVENIPSWRKVPLKDHLERRYCVPACINNDANAFAVGELYFGKGRGHRNLVGITLGTGLGVGIVIDGRLYSGTNCGAGEIGSIPYRGSTIERCCSGEYLRRQSGVAGEVVFERALAGDSASRELMASLGTALGDAILILLYTVDPEIVVLGGSVSAAFPLFEKAMRTQLESFVFRHAMERLLITTSEIRDVALLGAAAIYLDGTRA